VKSGEPGPKKTPRGKPRLTQVRHVFYCAGWGEKEAGWAPVGSPSIKERQCGEEKNNGTLGGRSKRKEVEN